MMPNTTLTAAVIAAGEELMRWFKSKDGTIYPDPANAPEDEKRMAEARAKLRSLSTGIDKNREAEMAYLRQREAEATAHARRLLEAVGSLVLRLRVLDLDQLEKDMGYDGTVPLRLSLAELRKLMAAYANESTTFHPDYRDCGQGLTTTAPVDWTYTTSSTTTDPWGKTS